MELIHYTNNDDTNSIGKKTDVNLRRMAARINDRHGVLLAEIEDLKKRMTEAEKRITALEGRMDAIEARMDAAEQEINSLKLRMDTAEANIDNISRRTLALERQRAVPINGAVLASLSQPFRPEDYYDGMYWENIGSIQIIKEGGGTSTLPIWKRKATAT